MRKIPYGEANFEVIRNEDLLYVDKTMYIEKLEESPDLRKTTYLRPRRFGKSLFTNMLTCYYSIDMEDKFEKLFKGLYIYDHPTKNKNNYYVLNFNFSGFTISNNNMIEDAKTEFYNKVKLSMRKFINRYNLDIKVNGNNVADMLANLLTDFEELKLKNKIYIIIDEYDNFTNAILRGDAKEFLELVNENGYVRAFYEVIKENLETGPVERFFATGVLPVTLDNLTSGFNVTTNISTSPKFISMIGFTHEEVRKIVEELVAPEDVEKVYKDLNENYDGYRFSLDNEEKIFNSTLVLYYLKNYIELHKAPRNLIDINMNTSGDKIKRIVELMNPDENYKIVEEIVLGNEVSGELKDVVLNESYNTDNLLTMLFYLGYLTISDVEYNQVIYKIPNYVTSTIFAEYMAKVIEENKKYNIDIKDISEAIKSLAIKGDISLIVNLVKNFLEHSSNRDTEHFSEKELKHTFAMFLSLTRQYAVYGEYPAKQGFADIFVQKKSENAAKYEAVIELKYLSKKEGKKANKKKLIKDAKEQLQRYLEDERLGDRENLKRYAIVFIGFDEAFVEEI